MPQGTSSINQQQHLDQGEKNWLLAKALLMLKANHNDWIVTICYYAAWHYIISQMTQIQKLPENHAEFLQKVNNHFDYSVWENTSWLKDWSENARYYPDLAQNYRNESKRGERALEKLEKIKSKIGI